MSLDNFAEVKTHLANIHRIESERLAIWTKYSGARLKVNHAWFSFDDGNLSVKNLDQEIMDKMPDIADQLQAKVQGDEGEVYVRSAGKVIIQKSIKHESIRNNNQKPWWKLW